MITISAFLLSDLSVGEPGLGIYLLSLTPAAGHQLRPPPLVRKRKSFALSFASLHYTEPATIVRQADESLVQTQYQSHAKSPSCDGLFAWLSLQVTDFADTILDIEP